MTWFFHLILLLYTMPPTFNHPPALYRLSCSSTRSKYFLTWEWSRLHTLLLSLPFPLYCITYHFNFLLAIIFLAAPSAAAISLYRFQKLTVNFHTTKVFFQTSSSFLQPNIDKSLSSDATYLPTTIIPYAFNLSSLLKKYPC